jgi:outer membrane immunogenic protein
MQAANRQKGASMRWHIGLGAVVLALALCGGTGASLAYDRYGEPVLISPLPYNWSGVYVGGHAGGANSRVEWTFTTPTETLDQGNNAFIGGAQAGLQWQWSNLVLGAEVMYSWASLEDSSGAALQPGISLTSEVNNLLLVTGKVGYAYENYLAYAKGGWARADVDFRSTVTATGALATSSSGRENGWTAGVGLEYAISQHINIGVEYDYIRLNVDPRTQVAGPAGVAGSTAIDAGVDIQTVMARLNFKFGPRPPEAAPPLK